MNQITVFGHGLWVWLSIIQFAALIILLQMYRKLYDTVTENIFEQNEEFEELADDLFGDNNE